MREQLVIYSLEREKGKIMKCCNHIFIKQNCLCHNCNGGNCDYNKEKVGVSYE